MGGEADAAAAVAASSPLDAWVDELAQAKGSPGGGAACGVMLAASAALLQMVAGYSPGDDRIGPCTARVGALRHEALRAAEADGILSASLGEALALDPGDDARDARVAEASLAAARSSAALGEIGVSIAGELQLLRELANASVMADLVVAGEALAAGIAGAHVNLLANIGLMRAHGSPSAGATDAGAAAELRAVSDRLDDVRAQVRALAEHVVRGIAEG